MHLQFLGLGRASLTRRRQARGGFTLIEMMVTVTITLIILGTVMTIFGMVSGAVRDNQAIIETVDRLKSVTARLQADLNGHTALSLPPISIESASGYFLYVEGNNTDARPDSGQGWLEIPKDSGTQELVTGQVLGDCDDVLAMTVRSRSGPFVGRGPDPSRPLESYLAEIVWFVKPAELPARESGGGYRPLTLYRRVLLIVSKEQMQGAGGTGKREFFEKYDISARLDPTTSQMVPNTLADLTMPENRFSHGKAGKMGQLQLGADSPMRPFPATSERYGEDVMLTNVVGFDIKAFDPWAGFGSAAGDSAATVPGDFQYTPGGLARGVYVDIGGAGGGDYSTTPSQKAPPMPGGIRGLFDTWSSHYEHDGEGPPGARDRGSNLLDDDGTGGVDDGAERQGTPPYLRPLRGVQISVRCYEPDSRQVQQVTVVGDFMPF